MYEPTCTDGEYSALAPHPVQLNGQPACHSLLNFRRRQPLALQWFPHVVAAQVLPKALQPPDHVQLPVGKMFEEAVTHEPPDVLPVIITFVGNFFLQHGANGNHRRKCVSEDQELQKKFPAYINTI